MVVLDASLVGPLVIPDERPALSDIVSHRLSSERIVVPSHWRLEVASMVQTAIKRGRARAEDRAAMFDALSLLWVEVDSSTWLVAWGDTMLLADRHRLTPYDAAYLELARRTGYALATLDDALIRAAQIESVALLGLTL